MTRKYLWPADMGNRAWPRVTPVCLGPVSDLCQIPSPGRRGRPVANRTHVRYRRHHGLRGWCHCPAPPRWSGRAVLFSKLIEGIDGASW